MRLTHRPEGWTYTQAGELTTIGPSSTYPSREAAVRAAHQAGLAVSPLGLVSVADCPVCAVAVAPRQTI